MIDNIGKVFNLTGGQGWSGGVPETRKINGKPLTEDVDLTASDVGARSSAWKPTPSEIGAAEASHTHSGYVPSTRTINGKALGENISLTASDVEALPVSGGTITGNLTLKGSNNFGTKLNFGDGDYVHISEPTDDCMEIKAKKINFVVSDTTDTKFTLNGEKIGGGDSAEPGTATPAAAGTASVGTSEKYAREDHVHPAQTAVTGNAGTATKLATARNIDGVDFNGSAAITHYGTCTTAGATAAKTVSCTGFKLVTGARIAVKFTERNTAKAPTLNVNGTGAKSINMWGVNADETTLWRQAELVEFVYDGTEYMMLNGAARYWMEQYNKDGAAGAEPGTATPAAAGTASVGTSEKFAREDHVHPAQTTVTGNAGTATKLAATRTIDGVGFNGSAAIKHYGTCATAAATAAKTVTLTGFSLVTGARVAVKFTYANTAENPTLNVNSTGAKDIAKYGTTLAGNGAWDAGEVVEFVYDGTRFVIVDGAAREKAMSGGDSAEPGTATPAAAGTASVDTSEKYAREDHVHPKQTSVTGNAGTATKLATARNIDGVDFDGSVAITHYGMCATAAATAAKTVSCTGFKLVTGARVAVKFTYANTAANPTLNVNSTGAKSIKAYGTTALTNLWSAGEVAEFVYDGTNFVMVNGYTTYYARNHTHSSYVPTTRKINGKALTGDITLTAADIGAGGGTTTRIGVNLRNNESVTVTVEDGAVYLIDFECCVRVLDPSYYAGVSSYTFDGIKNGTVAVTVLSSTSVKLTSNNVGSILYINLYKL